MPAEYARGKAADELVAGTGVSMWTFFHRLAEERAKFNSSRVQEWKSRGLSLREIGRFYGKSHEAVRQAVGEKSEDGGMRSEEEKEGRTGTD
jgi:hypothetical protein